MNGTHDDFAFEPVPGLPERLPEGETLLWQGSPEWRSLARSAFHTRKVALYFAALILWHCVSAVKAGDTVAAAILSALPLLAGGAAALAILTLLAFLYARGTIYTLTTKRFVFRSGLALPITLNLPLALIDGAAMTRSAKAAGSIALTVAKPNRVAFLVLWPNARPWRVLDPQPTLRCIPDVEAVAALVARTLEAEAGAVRRPVRAAPMPTGEVMAFPSGRTVAA
ncbi:photosynthetic complex putative assembly protein PuhB [Aureimonas leprariae]|uniref:PH domain-containing protein n=1 Tax=Plantimonas leprariae TaxID=2615207 RepID=A0A7V7U0G8_9HYPH|nr:photosynthetic complex putative assembly protein PuhB [Aureimonas leprariae]KAB0680331.1 PH domain-containing protein [Aureimonas leprariae]